jgi:Tol biopolymer transport system component
MKKIIIKVTLVFAIILVSNQISNAQFGKNKVQYEKFKWKYIESNNFDVYFHKGGEYIAKFAAIEAEKALIRIQGHLGHKLQKRITLIIFNSHNQFQQNNVIDQFLSEGIGGVTQIYKNRIVMPYQGNWAQFRHLIGHELVHGVINDMFHGGSLQASISNGGYFMPTWLNEGFAEWSSQRMETATDMFMRDITISEYLPSLNRISGYMAYRAGQTFYWYVEKNYGKEKITEFLNRLKIKKNVDAAFEDAFGMNLQDFSEVWERDIKKYYWPEIDIFENPKDFAIEVTNRKKMENFYNSSPAISPDGEKMAFISDSDGLLGISVMRIDDPESKRNLVSSFRTQDFEDLNILTPGISWNPEGNKIAISAKAGGEDAVFIVDEESGDYEKILFGYKAITSVAWSPDGKKLAFIATEDEQSDIYTYTISTEEVAKITNDIFSDEMPIWSSDSKSIYFISDRGNRLSVNISANDISIWDHQIETSDIYKIILGERTCSQITFTPDFKETSFVIDATQDNILYVSDENGISNLYKMNIANRKISPVTNSITGLNHVSLALDGSKLLFGTQIKAGYDIFMLNNPFEIELKINELPLTRFRKNQLNLPHDEITVEEGVADEDEEKISYGSFAVDFSDEKAVVRKDVSNDKKANFNDNSEIDTNFIPLNYKLQFTPDIISANPGYSNFYGYQAYNMAMFSDQLGNHKIIVQANLVQDLATSTIVANYSYLPGVIDYNFTAYSNPLYYGQYATNANGQRGYYSFKFKNIGVSLLASYPFDLFNRLEFGASYMNIGSAPLYSNDNDKIPTISRHLIVPEVKFVHDDALGAGYVPTMGTRAFIKIYGTPKLGNQGISFFTTKMDIRHYLPVTSWINMAFRFTGGVSLGSDPVSFNMGGTSNWMNLRVSQESIFESPEDYAFMNFEMPLRGWDLNQTSGSKFFLYNMEMRYPLFTALIAGPVPILIQGVEGAFFLDVGGAWDDKFYPRIKLRNGKIIYKDLLTSSGVGIRSFIFGMPLKLDIAWRYEFSGWSQPQYLISFGFDW